MSDHPVILMLGTDPQAPGGISAVLQTYLQQGLAQEWSFRIVPTWKSGPAWQRVGVAASAWFTCMGLMLRPDRPQIMHAHTAARGSFWRKALFLLPAKAMGLRTILHLHDGTFPDWYARLPEPARWLVRSVLRHADRVIVLTPGWRDQLSPIEPSACWRIVPNPVAWPAHPARPIQGRVLFLGRLWASKGVPELLRAVQACASAHDRLQLICAGDGDVQGMGELAHQLGIGKRVRLLGRVDDRVCKRLLRRSQLLVLPSHAEGLPLAVLEAMAFGVPVLASDVGGIPEALSEGGGITVAPGDVQALGDALRHLLDDPTTCARMGAQGREIARRRYAPTVVFHELGQIYRELGLQPRPAAGCAGIRA